MQMLWCQVQSPRGQKNGRVVRHLPYFPFGLSFRVSNIPSLTCGHMKHAHPPGTETALHRILGGTCHSMTLASALNFSTCVAVPQADFVLRCERRSFMSDMSDWLLTSAHQRMATMKKMRVT